MFCARSLAGLTDANKRVAVLRGCVRSALLAQTWGPLGNATRTFFFLCGWVHSRPGDATPWRPRRVLRRGSFSCSAPLSSSWRSLLRRFFRIYLGHNSRWWMRCESFFEDGDKCCSAAGRIAHEYVGHYALQNENYAQLSTQSLHLKISEES